MKKTITIVFILLLSLTLGSCKKEEGKTSQPTYLSETTELVPSSVEEVVSEVYDAVVAIDAYKGNNLYGSGSGVFYAFDEKLNLSYIMTCYHVIDDCDNFMIKLIDGNIISAKLVGGDPALDVAVLSVQGLGYKYVDLFDSDKLRLGAQVVIIGNPLGTLPGSVSVGYISYLNREVISEDYRTLSLIQTDAAINSGNSGGAMFDMQGRLIGIVNAKYAKEGIEGLGFAIPINKAKEISDSVFDTAKYDSNNNEWEKGYYIGSFEFAFIMNDISTIFGDSYVIITGISNNETTSGYGLFKIGDEIDNVKIKYDNKEVVIADFKNAAELYLNIYNLDLELDDELTFSIIRDRKLKEVSFTLKQFIPN